MTQTKERLSYLKIAAEVQKSVSPYINVGKDSLWTIYINHLVREYPVSMNTLRKMLKEDVTNLEQRIEEFRKKQEERHAKELEKKRRKRIK